MRARSVHTDPVAERGTTEIDDRVYRRLAEHAALAVPGAVRHRALAGRQLPRASFVGTNRTQCDLEVAAAWPLDAAELIPAIRRSVADELHRSLGATVTDVRVHVARIDHEHRSRHRPSRLHAATEPPPEPDGAADRTNPSRLHAKHAPRRTAGASIAAVPLLLALLVLGGLALRDTAATLGWVHGGRWLDAVPRIAEGMHWTWWVWPIAIGALIVGALLFVAAVKPRKRSHTAVSDELWISRRLATARAARSTARPGTRTGTKTDAHTSARTEEVAS